jgi:CheY-like chemotaxis protein
MTTDKKDFTNRLADLRHDLRTPAGHVMGYAEIIEEEFEGEDHPEILSNLSSLKKQGELLLELIDEYLGARTKDISEVLSRGASENLARPLVTIEDSCNTLRPLLEKTGGADDLEKVEKAALHLAELIEGIPQALSGPEMPVTEEPELESTQEIPSPGVSVLGEGGVILIVDDNEANRDLLGRKLQAQGYTPVVVEGGEAALKYLESEEVDIILLDMIMPGMSGAEVLRSLKSSAATKNIPVVMLSALDDMEKVVACISMGAEDYLFKPANPVLLKARISATLHGRRGLSVQAGQPRASQGQDQRNPGEEPSA